MKARVGCVLSCLIIACDASTPACSLRYADNADAVETMVMRLERERSSIVYIPGRVVSLGSSASDFLDRLRIRLTVFGVATRIPVEFCLRQLEQHRIQRGK